MARLRELAAVGLEQQRQVRVCGCPVAERPLQQDLAWRAGEQVATTDHLRDTLQLVVDHHRQVIGEKPVPPPDHKVAGLAVAILAYQALQAVREYNLIFPCVCSKTQRVRPLARVRIVATGSRVDQLVPGLKRLRGKLRAAASTGIAEALGLEASKGLLVIWNSIVLEFYFSIPFKTKCLEDPGNLLGGPGHHPIAVEVFDPEEPSAIGLPGTEVASERGKQGAEMQGTRGRRGKTAAGAVRIGGSRGRGQAGDGFVSQRYQSSRSPYCFSRRSRRSWASMHRVATGRASRRFTPIGSPVSMQ